MWNFAYTMIGLSLLLKTSASFAKAVLFPKMGL
jgi:hypothetical protein